MRRFINREAELKTLNDEYINKETSFTVIFGRRRTGKTTLIQEFLKNKPSLYYIADTQNEKIQIQRFQEQLADTFNDEFFRKLKVENWEIIFEYLEKKLKSDTKFILAIDEFQYLVKSNKNFSSVFQRIYDAEFKKKNIMIIICGSLLSMMYNEVLSYTSPLYGRRTSQINLKQIPFKFYQKFFPEKTKEELINFYSVTGGIPKYIEFFYECKNIFSAIERDILNKNKFLYMEPRFLLHEEVNEVSTYFSILDIIADGNHKFNKITDKLGVQTNNLTPFMKKMIELDIVEKKVPITEDNPKKSKKGLYFIKDNFLKFWFRYVFPNQSYLEIENRKFVLDKIRSDFKLYVSTVFEDICAEKLWEIKFPFMIKKCGKWWDKNTEIDVVALGENEIIFGECKWSKKHIGINILEELKEKSKQVSWKKNTRKEYFILFSKSGFSIELSKLSEKKNNVFLMDVEDF